MELWKVKTCGKCSYADRAPRDPNKPIDLTEPKILVCRFNPPNIVYAMAQAGNGQPVPMPMAGAYPAFLENNQACSHYKEIKESTLPDLKLS